MQHLEKIAEILSARKESLVSAESLTGGLIAENLTRIAGASLWFRGAFVVYTPAMKHSVLKVSLKTLKTFGAISKECAEEMAKGALNQSGATWALAASGVAGPFLSENKPVGKVWMAIANQNGEIFTFKENFKGERQAIRQQSADFILMEFLKILKKRKV